MNRYCDECIAEKVLAKLVKPMHEYYNYDALHKYDFKYNEKCALCDKKAHTVTAYPPMDKFYRQKALLAKYSTVTSVSKKELAELQKKCNELGIPIGKVAPDMMKKLAIDDKNAISHAGEPTNKYKTFEEYFLDEKLTMSFAEYDQQEIGWNAAVKYYPAEIEYIDRTKNEINELQGIITGTLQIQCTCDQAQIKKGYRCSCGKQKAVQKAVADLTFYLKELKKT